MMTPKLYLKFQLDWGVKTSLTYVIEGQYKLKGNDHIAGAFEVVNGVKKALWLTIPENQYELKKWDYNRRYKFIYLILLNRHNRW